MSKKIFSIIIMVLLLLGLCGTVFAKDTYTATSTINGVTVNWEYELNNSNQIENLKCTNSTDLTGNVKIPANIDGKTVVTLGDEAFKSAKGITEITIPNSVTEIGYSAFENCTKLNKITILDNVQEMGFYNISNSDSIFKNHNEDLTIYCYKDSMAANYAIKYNIKYVYLTQKDINDKTNSEEKQDDKNSDITETTINKTQKDTTTATGELPQTGVSSVIIISFIVVTIISIAIFKKYNSYKDIN